jgi:uncharacterized phage-associated protein
MRPAFREDKTTQAAAFLLKLRGGKMSYMKLIKLLYLADRKALLEWRRPITFDSYVSMDNGPVLSRTLDLINEGTDLTLGGWSNAISQPLGDHEVELRSDPGTEELSKAEEDILRKVFTEFGTQSRWELRDYTHKLPEWRDPKGSAIPIALRDILLAGGRSEGDAEAFEHEIESLALAKLILS